VDQAPFLWDRRNLMKVLGGAGLACARPEWLAAQESQVLEVASAGSIHTMLEGPLKQAAQKKLSLDLNSHSGGADMIARSILNNSVPADVYIPITASPMRMLMNAGRAKVAYPIASTEMVIVYSPKSRFAGDFAEAAAGKRRWWEVLQEPGLRFARSNPADDPGGRNIIFTVMLASKIYNQPGLVDKVLGAPLNPAQVQPGVNTHKGLESGEIDAAGSYRIATHASDIPFLTLPADINLSDTHIREKYPEISLTVKDKTFYPEPLYFYAATVEGAKNPQGAVSFVRWLRGKDAAELFRENGFGLPAEPAAILK
jgi:molybdate/tungstate transport system substrate-binding protein